VRVPNSSVFSFEQGFTLFADGEGGATTIEASCIVLATGARERFLPFPGWTLPNVLGVGAAQALLKSGLSFAGKTVVIGGSGPLLVAVASSLARAGARVAFVAEQAPRSAVLRFGAGLWRDPGIIRDAFAYRRGFAGSPYRFGTWIAEARGEDRLREAALTDGARTWSIACDYLCAGFGLVPSTELARLFGCRIDGEAVAVDDSQRTSVEGVYCAGEPTGIGGVEKALTEGEIAGWSAAGRHRQAAALLPARRRLGGYARRMECAFALREELRRLARPDTTVCRCEDVPLSAFDPAWSAREAKLYVRAGMGPCQGRVCGPALRYLFGWESDSVRVPISPVPIDTLVSAGAGMRGPEDDR
jgi:NADPH-dependent 2,4-dienoyl-CoA reductase/sulfur reductase-like enzyme